MLVEQDLPKPLDPVESRCPGRFSDLPGEFIQLGEGDQLIELGIYDSTDQEAAQVETDSMLVSPGQSSKLPRQMKIVMFYETLRYIFTHESRLAGTP
ncbi:MAG: hypothetical protein OXT70_02800 [Chloroflexota bacterium]|nr:hypothetical protein [Chloroflexota bacterium]